MYESIYMPATSTEKNIQSWASLRYLSASKQMFCRQFFVGDHSQLNQAISLLSHGKKSNFIAC